jgi:VWFA-related protein
VFQKKYNRLDKFEANFHPPLFRIKIKMSFEGGISMRQKFFILIATVLLAFVGMTTTAKAQEGEKKTRKQQAARPVTVPFSVRQGDIKIGGQRGEIIEAGNLTVKENGEERTILSVRNTADSPLHFAVLLQDDVASSVNLELKGIGEFIRKLPRGSRVMVGYMRGGSLQIRQKFTEDLERAADSLRVITSSSASAPFNPYVGVIEALERFENLPTGRRAMLVVSDGLDVSRGTDSASPGQSVDLDRAITKAQRAGVAVYSIYAATDATERGNSVLVSYGQGSLNRLTDETGGRAFFSGSSTPVSFAPFLRDLGAILSRQFAITYLSTDNRRNFRKIEISSDNPAVKIEHPRGVVPK